MQLSDNLYRTVMSLTQFNHLLDLPNPRHWALAMTGQEFFFRCKFSYVIFCENFEVEFLFVGCFIPKVRQPQRTGNITVDITASVESARFFLLSTPRCCTSGSHRIKKTLDRICDTRSSSENTDSNSQSKIFEEQFYSRIRHVLSR